MVAKDELIILGFIGSFLGFLISAVWLAILGQWEAIAVGLFAAFVGVPLARSRQLNAPARMGFELGGVFFATLSTVYLYGLVSIWCAGTFWLAASETTEQAALLPAALWSYGAVMWPWNFSRMLELRDDYFRDNEMIYYSCSLYFIHLGCIIAGLMIALAHPTFFDLLGTFIVVMAAALFLQIPFLRRVHRFLEDEKLRRMVATEVEAKMERIRRANLDGKGNGVTDHLNF